MPAVVPYIGRFAPSPSGDLHLGSLVTALGSYLQARSKQGQWRLRIDDLDTPRVVPGASERICETLQAHGLAWDGPVYYQSEHLEEYAEALEFLQSKGLVYPCDCTRKAIKQLGPIYTQICKHKPSVSSPHALRFANSPAKPWLNDNRLGRVDIDQQAASEDFILKRRDGLFAYHLASVVDDIAMSITEIVRGEDLLVPTACQVSLFNALEAPLPQFMHLPLVCFADGRKYSKQNHAPSLAEQSPLNNLRQAMSYLGLDLSDEVKLKTVEDHIQWALQHWSKATRSN